MLKNSQKFRVLWHGRTEHTEVPGRYKNAVLVSRVFVARAYRAYRSSGYGYECRTELTEVPGTGQGCAYDWVCLFLYDACRTTQGLHAVLLRVGIS